MIFDVGLLNLVLYCAQQLGIALGLGAQTIMLVAYVSAMYDGVIDVTEKRFLRATRNTLWVSLALIAVSGIAITALHVVAGQGLTVLSPAYLFKLLLIVVVIVLTALLHTLPETFAEGLLGGSWYALFVVHILAPVTTWANLVTLWVVWMVGFNLMWYAIVFSTREHKKTAEVHKGSLFFNHKKAEVPTLPVAGPSAEGVQAPVAPIAVPAAPTMPQHFQPITLDAAPIAKAPVAEAVTPTPPPALRTVPARPITLPIEKLPAGITTDTPFLPQVPPLQPIPTIPPTPTTPTNNQAAATPAINTAPTSATEASTITPEIKAGLNVMPKSADQIQP